MLRSNFWESNVEAAESKSADEAPESAPVRFVRNMARRLAAGGLLALCSPWPSLPLCAAPLSIETFAASDAIVDAAISPDGRYLAEVRQLGRLRLVAVVDRQAAQPVKYVLKDTDNGAQISWCSWASNSRLVCSYRGISYFRGEPVAVTRLVAVNADGKNQLVLLQNSGQGGGGQFDRIIDWNPGTPDTVLIEAQEDLLDASAHSIDASHGAVIGRISSGAYPAVFELNVVTGKTRLLIHSFQPILHVITDYHGTPRVAYGLRYGSKDVEYFVRPSDGGAWRHLLKYEAFSANGVLTPVAIDSTDPTHAYAMGPYQQREALWSVDLNDKDPPRLLYSNSKVDVAEPLLLKDGHFYGAIFETERPHIYYTDPRFATLMKGVDAALPDTFNTIVDSSADRTLLVIRARSDVEPGAYYLFDTAKPLLTAIAAGNAALDPAQLGRMLSISFPARDGTIIPGYLTRPPGDKSDHLPLIVMPHGGPIARDGWDYFFLQQFLANRGYAVLQMNFRGSSGYGDQWFRAAHQDWGGLTYDDIVDGAKWAISSGIADPNRVAVVGWSFGGYAALLGAVRNSDLFHCAVSIAGISDLSLLEQEANSHLNNAIAREQIGTDLAKLKADSPRRHADAVQIPILMVHGEKDPQVDIEQSRAMAAALKSAGKPYQLIEIKDADHQIRPPEDRATLLTAVESYLSTCMPAGTSPSAH
jgi:dienelactone hydrolase